jgi:hypothetical protein
MLGLAITQLSITPSAGALADFRVMNPNGSVLLSTCTRSAPGLCQLPALPTTGTYSLRVVPNGPQSFSTTVMLSNTLIDTIAGDGVAKQFQQLRPGQAMRLTIPITAGQSFSLEWSGTASWPHNGLLAYMSVPNGGFAYANTVGSSSAWDEKYDLANLQPAGTWVVGFTPQGIDTGGTASARIWPEVTLGLSVGGGDVTMTGNAGQNGRYTFAGTSGAHLALGISQLSTIPAGQSITYTVLNPNGSALTSCSRSSISSCAIPALGTTGTYAIRVVPSGPQSFNTTVNLTAAP